MARATATKQEKKAAAGYAQSWYQRSKSKVRARVNRSSKASNLRRAGMMAAEAEKGLAAYEQSDGACWSCGKGCAPQIDHCHETGKFRGLLCLNCNVGLGHLGDSEAAVLKILAYLRR